MTPTFAIYYFAGTPVRPIGFSAYLTNQTRFYSEGEQIQFPATLTNVGYHYQAESSLFVCPVDGLYAFATFLVSIDYNPNYSATIMHEGAALTSALTHTDGNHDQGQALTVTSCYAGDRVWVQKLTEVSPIKADDDAGEKLSSFSGYLIRAF